MKKYFIISTIFVEAKNLQFGFDSKFGEKARPPTWSTPNNMGENRNVISNMIQWKYSKEQSAGNLDDSNKIHPELLMSYGCYCQIGTDHYYNRHGLPRDDLDKVCQKWKRCLVCAAGDSGLDCSPETTTYVTKYSSLTREFECRTADNPDTCTMRTCQCDTQLVHDIFDQIDNFDFYKTTSGGFDPTTACEVRSMTDRYEPDQCCGEYPNRFPYASLGGQRGCCGSRLYETYSLECCSEDEVKLRGTCHLSNHVENPCDYSPCKNDGRCQKDGGQLGFFCQCDEKWTGALCQVLRYPCVDHPITCFNGGTQKNQQGVCICTCPVGFEGNHCQKGSTGTEETYDRFPYPALTDRLIETEDAPTVKPTTEEPTTTTTTTTTLSTTTWTAPTKKPTTVKATTATTVQRVGPCSPSPCKNDGKCSETGSKYPWMAYKCTCKKGDILYSGKNCQYGPCNPNPCINGGTCTIPEIPINGYQNFECSCPPEYLGYFCEQRKRHNKH